MKTLKVMSEAQFLAGEDARGVLVILEPETELTNEHLDALVARDAEGFVSDLTDERFEKPDERPTLSYDTMRYAKLLAIPVSPRQGVRLRTLAGAGFLRLTVEGANIVETVMPPAKPKRDRTKDPEIERPRFLRHSKKLEWRLTTRFWSIRRFRRVDMLSAVRRRSSRR